MVTIKRIRNLDIIINTRGEHYPIHIHVRNGKNKARVFMNYKWDLISGKFSKKDVAEVNAYLAKNREQIKKAYKRMMEKGETPTKIG